MVQEHGAEACDSPTEFIIFIKTDLRQLFKLPKYCSIFLAEAFTIRKATEIVKEILKTI